MLTAFGKDLWLAEGDPIVAAAGFHYPTRMVVVRLHDGGMLVWSPVALTDALHAEVSALGPVRHLIAPNGLHHMFLADWIAACPQAQVHGAPGLPEKRPDLTFDSVLGDTAPAAWLKELEQVVLTTAITNEVVFFHKPSGTVIFTDLLQHLPKGWFRGWRALVAHLDLMTGEEPAVPRKFRLAFRDKAAARRALARVLAWPAQAVVMAHGTPVTTDAPLFLRRAFRWLTR